MRRRDRVYELVLLLFFAPPLISRADDRVDYAAQVKPLLKARCFACHGPLKQKGGLRLDAAEFLRKGGDSGPSVVPGNPQKSELLQRVASKDEAVRMPKDASPLTAAQIANLSRWIADGAQSPAGEQPEPDPRAHWAFRSLRRPQVSQVARRWPKNPIDAILSKAHSQHGLKPVGPAEKPLLLRRAYLDLIGLPPTTAELHAFLADQRPDAWPRVVDALLANPHHGECWGRHWMDVWRYADGWGLENQDRNSQKHIWRWREWIVESLNEDTGYDRMILEMLAGDELAPLAPKTLRATGFLARNYYLFNRTTWLDDTIEHTSKAFLGLTINCAKCHDHKYDPLTQVDYYRMRALFEPHQVRMDMLPGEADLDKQGLPRVYDAHPNIPTYVRVRGDENAPDTAHPVLPGVPEILDFGDWRVTPVPLPEMSYAPWLRHYVFPDLMEDAKRAIQSARQRVDKARRNIATFERRARAADAGAAEKKRLRDEMTRMSQAEKTLAAAELRPLALETAYAASLGKRRKPAAANVDTLVSTAASAANRYAAALAGVAVADAEVALIYSDAKSEAELKAKLKEAEKKLGVAQRLAAAPGTAYAAIYGSLKALEGPDETEESRRQPFPAFSTGRRTALARWIVDRRNPLTARVAVNHIWLRHFGEPLVDPPDDFGRRTSAPPLQELLDWLAEELIESGWDMKYLHRLIVTSETYRLDSESGAADAATRKGDPANHYYWRRRPLRMEAEVVRDTLLNLAGALDERLGGPAVDPTLKSTRRRSVYFARTLDVQDQFLATFDGASILDCYRRNETVLPQQALAMANSRIPMEMSRIIASRLNGSRPGSETQDRDVAAFVDAAFETVLGRQARAEEISECVQCLDKMGKALGGALDARQQARAAIVLALFNHNDFVTIR